MENQKYWWQSKTIVAALVTLIGSVFGIIGIDILDLDTFNENMTETITALGLIVTTSLTIHGRMTATAAVVKKKSAIGE